VDHQISRYGSYGVIIRKGKILLTQKERGPYKGLWGLPGGEIEFKEFPEDTLKREILEETAHLSHEFELLCIATNNQRYNQETQNIDFHHVGIIYIVKKIELVPDLTAEEEMKWSALNCLDLSDLTPFANEAVAQLTGL